MSQSRLDHAFHNEKVCDYLSEDGSYPDWVITTAFYSALHFLQHKLFPLSVSKPNGKQVECSDFEKYCTESEGSGRKHNKMRKLVEEEFEESISATYNNMLDLSWAARYHNYQQGPKLAKQARRRLTAIKNYCT